MANRFYATGQERSAKVRDLFAVIAHRYDLINDLQSLGLHRRWKSHLVRLAQMNRGGRALDLCCGTGDVAFAMAKAGSDVVGLDFSMPMLAIAKRRAQSLLRTGSTAARSEAPEPTADSGGRYERLNATEQTGRTGAVEFLQADALRLPFQDAAFRVVSISYGLRNLENVNAGLSEMWRVLQPGGRLLVLDFGKPDNPGWRALYFAYLRCCVPMFGRLFCGDSQTYAYILESLAHYPAQRGIAALMQQMQFRDVGVKNFLGGVMSINYGVKAGR